LGAILADGRYSRVFQGVDEVTQQAVIVKFPKPAVAGHAILRHAFVRESWIATRVRSPFLGECIEMPAGRQHCLYTVMTFYEGETLERRLLKPPSIRLASGLRISRRRQDGRICFSQGVPAQSCRIPRPFARAIGDPCLADHH
jgi:serine/threonine protein kinase